MPSSIKVHNTTSQGTKKLPNFTNAYCNSFLSLYSSAISPFSKIDLLDLLSYSFLVLLLTFTFPTLTRWSYNLAISHLIDQFSNRFLVSKTRYTAHSVCRRQTIHISSKLCSKASHDNFTDYLFPYFHH